MTKGAASRELIDRHLPDRVPLKTHGLGPSWIPSLPALDKFLNSWIFFCSYCTPTGTYLPTYPRYLAPRSNLEHMDNIYMAQAGSQTYLPPFQSNLLSPDPEVGSRCEIRQYERIKNAKGETVLLKTGTARSALGTQPRDSWSAPAALVVTRHTDDRDCIRTEVEVQSRHIKAALKACVPEFSDFDLDRQAIILKDEPRCVFYYRHNLFRYHDRCVVEGDTDARDHVAFLLNYMFRTLDREVQHFTRFMENPVFQPSTEFLNLWMAFVPGELVYAEAKCGHQKGRGRIFRLKTIERCPCTRSWCPQYAWLLTGRIINYDGENFGHDAITLKIEHYDGMKALQDLRIVPLRYHPDSENLQRELIARGKRFVQLSGRHYMAYKGTAELMSDDRNSGSTGEEDTFPLRSTYVSHSKERSIQTTQLSLSLTAGRRTDHDRLQGARRSPSDPRACSYPVGKDLPYPAGPTLEDERRGIHDLQ